MTTGRRAEVGSGTAAVVTYVHERVRRRRRRRRRRRNVAGRRLVAAAAPVRHGRRRFSGPLWRCFRFVGGRSNIFDLYQFLAIAVAGALMRRRYRNIYNNIIITNYDYEIFKKYTVGELESRMRKPASFARSYRLSLSLEIAGTNAACANTRAAEKAFRAGGVRRTRRVYGTKECAALATCARLQRRRRGFAGCWTGARAWIDACAFPAIPTGWVRENNHAAAPTTRESTPYPES